MICCDVKESSDGEQCLNGASLCFLAIYILLRNPLQLQSAIAACPSFPVCQLLRIAKFFAAHSRGVVLMSNFSRSRRLLPLLHRITTGGQSFSPKAPRHLERSLSTSSLRVLRDVGSSPCSWLWSRANFARSKFASGYTALAPKKLEHIMKIETVIFSPPEEIAEIWNDYHIGRGHISAVMGSELYKAFEQRANECPLFVLPLRKGTGFISVVVQAQMPYMLFTALEDYRVRGTEASPYFTVTHFTELVPTKGLVLVRGDIVFTSKLSDDEAETLLKTAHSFYINDDRYRKVRRFNKDSRDFDFKEVLQELDIPLQG